MGWLLEGQTFIFNLLRIKIMILQEAEIGIIAVGVTQIIIMGGIDLSSGSVVGMTAMLAASFAQTEGYTHASLSKPHGAQSRSSLIVAGLLGGLADWDDQRRP